MRIVISFDDNYAPHGATTIASVLAHTNMPVELSVLYYELKEETIETFTSYFHDKLKSIEFIKIQHTDISDILNVKIAKHLSFVAFLRILIPNFISDSFVLYLDCDVIVKGDIKELENYFPENEYISAVKEYDIAHKFVRMDNMDPILIPLENYMIRDAYYYRVRHNLGMSDSNFRYFNSGVMMINVTKWKQDKISSKLLEFIAKNPYLFSADQDALNAVIDGNFKALDPKWNNAVYPKGILTNYRAEQIRVAANQPSIIHFTGQVKPWMDKCTQPLKMEYWKYRIHTPWPASPPNPKIKDMLKSLKYKCRHKLLPKNLRVMRQAYNLIYKQSKNDFARAYLEE